MYIQTNEQDGRRSSSPANPAQNESKGDTKRGRRTENGSTMIPVRDDMNQKRRVEDPLPKDDNDDNTGGNGNDGDDNDNDNDNEEDAVETKNESNEDSPNDTKGPKGDKKRLNQPVRKRQRHRRSLRGQKSRSLAQSIVDGKQVVIITGAGLSVASGVRPFRGESGVWSSVIWKTATRECFRKDPLSW